MATTQDQVDDLNAAIDSGVRSVTIGGETTILNTGDSLIRARDDAERRRIEDAEKAAGRKRRPVTLLHYAGRGY